jgi:hypothetical protein
MGEGSKMLLVQSRRLAAGIAVATAIGCGPAGAQAVTTLSCSFESQHLAASEPGTWIGFEKGNSTTLTFTDIDPVRRTARVLQNATASEIRLIVGATMLTFVEVTPDGGVMATTVVTGPEGGGERTLNVVHSRHVPAASGEVTVAQYIGFCERG